MGGTRVPKVVAVIPARCGSSRFPGKPLADICGKPMIWWAYQRVKGTGAFDRAVCAIDGCRLRAACEELSLDYIITL